MSNTHVVSLSAKTVSQLQGAFNENPYSTAVGQEVISINETFLSRQIRLGRMRRVNIGAQSVNGSNVGYVVRAATASTLFYPTKYGIVTNVACTGYFEITTGVAQADTVRRAFSTSGAGVVDIEPFTKGLYVLPGGQINVYTTATSGTITFEVEGVEVAYNG